LTPWDRLLWIWFSRIWSDWRSALAIVEPETVVALHRAGFRLFWDLESATGPRWTTSHFPRAPRSDPEDVPGESLLGCAPHPR
jgi:hypothetical protein